MQAEFQAGEEALYWNEMTNKYDSEITKQLLATAALLIPLTGSIVATDVVLNGALKTLLIGSLVFFFISMIFGVIDIFMAVNLFKSYMDYNSKRANNYFRNRTHGKKLDDAESENRKLVPPPITSSIIPKSFQIASLGIGILLIIGVTVSLVVMHNPNKSDDTQMRTTARSSIYTFGEQEGSQK